MSDIWDNEDNYFNKDKEIFFKAINSNLHMVHQQNETRKAIDGYIKSYIIQVTNQLDKINKVEEIEKQLKYRINEFDKKKGEYESSFLTIKKRLEWLEGNLEAMHISMLRKFNKIDKDAKEKEKRLLKPVTSKGKKK